MKSTGVGYLLWLLCFLGLCGIHRFYAGKLFTGALWLITFGLLGVGQLIDLLLIPGMISDANLRYAAITGIRNSNNNVNNVHVHISAPAAAVAQPASH
jgi:TM2 domain-containing membrane protein YozV